MKDTEASLNNPNVALGKDSPLRVRTEAVRKKIGDGMVNRWPKLTPNMISAAGGALIIGGGVLIERENRQVLRSGGMRRKTVVATGLLMEAAGVLCDVLDGADAKAHNRKKPGSVDTNRGRIVDTYIDRVEEDILAAARAVSARKLGGVRGATGQALARGVEATTNLPSIIKLVRERGGVATSEVGTNWIERFGSRPGRVALFMLNGAFPRAQVIWDSAGLASNLYTTNRRLRSEGVGEYPAELRKNSAKGELVIGGLQIAAMIHARRKPGEHSKSEKAILAGAALLPLAVALKEEPILTTERLQEAQRALPHKKWGDKQPKYRDALRYLSSQLGDSDEVEIDKSVREAYPDLDFEAGRIKDAIEHKEYEGKVVVVTGATGAIGRETARQMALLGADVVMCVRNTQAAEAVRDEILQDPRINASKIHIQEMDLSDQKSVVNAINDINQSFPDGIDALVNNAGYTPAKYEERKETPEDIVDVNYLGPAVLTLGLLSSLRHGGQIVDITSSSQNGHVEDFEDGQFPITGTRPKKKHLKRVYYDLKLATEALRVAMETKLQDAGDDRGIRFVSFHPGNVHKIIDGRSIKSRASRSDIIRPLLASADESALGVLRILLTTKESGKYVYGNLVDFPDAATDPEFQQHVLNATASHLKSSSRELIGPQLRNLQNPRV